MFLFDEYSFFKDIMIYKCRIIIEYLFLYLVNELDYWRKLSCCVLNLYYKYS